MVHPAGADTKQKELGMARSKELRINLDIGADGRTLKSRVKQPDEGPEARFLNKYR